MSRRLRTSRHDQVAAVAGFPVIRSASSNATVVATLESDTTVTFPAVPIVGVWETTVRITCSVFGNLTAAGSAACDIFIEEDVDGGGFAAVQTKRMNHATAFTGPSDSDGDPVTFDYHLAPAVAGSVYKYRISFTNTSGYQLSAVPADPHYIVARMERTA